MLAGGLGVLHLRIAENGEVMVDRGFFERHPWKRFRNAGHRGVSGGMELHVGHGSLCVADLFLQFLDFFQILFVGFLILKVQPSVLHMGGFQLIDSLILLFDFLDQIGDQVFQRVELLVVNGGGGRDRQGEEGQPATGGGTTESEEGR